MKRWDMRVAAWCAAGAVLVLTACGSLDFTPRTSALAVPVSQEAGPGVLTQDADLDGVCFASSAEDENALRVGAGRVILRRVMVQKTGGTSDTWQNAALYVGDGAKVELHKASVASSVPGGGIYVQGSGSEADLTECAITTTADGAAGVYGADGVLLTARDLMVTTSGRDASPLYVQGGAVQVQGGTFTSGGDASPTVYAAGTAELREAELRANNAPALALGKSAVVRLTDCTLYTGQTGQTDGMDAALIVADGGDSDLEMDGGTLAGRETLFAVRDGACTIRLESVELAAPETTALLWAHSGAQVELTARSQMLTGVVKVEEGATLTLDLCQDSDFTGAVTTQDGVARVYVSRGSCWTLTGDSVLDELKSDGEIHYNGYSITLADGTILSG